jgi:hypothetical protein
MSITIDGSGTITGISVGGIPDGVVDTDVLADNAVVFGKIGTTEQGQLCKAWVNFNGTGTVAIRASYNVSSITDNGTGDYTVNFTTALADVNYSALVSIMRFSTGSFGDIAQIEANGMDASYVEVRASTTSANFDPAVVCVAIFR